MNQLIKKTWLSGKDMSSPQQCCFDRADDFGDKVFAVKEIKYLDKDSTEVSTKTYNSFKNHKEFVDYISKSKENNYYELIREQCIEYYDFDYTMKAVKENYGDSTDSIDDLCRSAEPTRLCRDELISKFIRDFLKIRNEFIETCWSSTLGQGSQSIIDKDLYLHLGDIKIDDCIVLEANSLEKFSLHVLIRRLDNRPIFFQHITDQKIFQTEFQKYLIFFKSFMKIDLSVYNNNSLFRCEGQTKILGEPRILKPWGYQANNITDKRLFLCSYFKNPDGYLAINLDIPEKASKYDNIEYTSSSEEILKLVDLIIDSVSLKQNKYLCDDEVPDKICYDKWKNIIFAVFKYLEEDECKKIFPSLYQLYRSNKFYNEDIILRGFIQTKGKYAYTIKSLHGWAYCSDKYKVEFKNYYDIKTNAKRKTKEERFIKNCLVGSQLSFSNFFHFLYRDNIKVVEKYEKNIVYYEYDDKVALWVRHISIDLTSKISETIIPLIKPLIFKLEEEKDELEKKLAECTNSNLITNEKAKEEKLKKKELDKHNIEKQKELDKKYEREKKEYDKEVNNVLKEFTKTYDIYKNNLEKLQNLEEEEEPIYIPDSIVETKPIRALLEVECTDKKENAKKQREIDINYKKELKEYHKAEAKHRKDFEKQNNLYNKYLEVKKELEFLTRVEPVYNRYDADEPCREIYLTDKSNCSINLETGYISLCQSLNEIKLAIVKNHTELKNTKQIVNKDLEKSSFLKGVIEFFISKSVIDEKFIKLLENKPSHLFPFEDKVYDFKLGQTRRRVMEDYFTFTTNNKYIQTTDEDKKIINDYISSLINTTEMSDVDKIEHTNCLLTYLSYCLTGENNLKLITIMKGALGDNGKTCFLNLIKPIMGKFGFEPQKKVFIESKSDSVHQTELFDLIGKRLTYISELTEKSKFNIDLLKFISGNDGYKNARRARAEENEDIKINCKLMIITNDIPKFDDDRAFSNRLMVIDFPNVFEKNPAKQEQILGYQNIFFSYLCETATKFYSEGMKFTPSKQSMITTLKEKQDKDSLLSYVEEKIIITNNPIDKMLRSTFLEEYNNYCSTSGYNKISRNRLYERFVKEYNIKVYNNRAFIGLKLSDFRDFEEFNNNDPLGGLGN